MKITWFGGTTVRVHLGGTMLVVDAAGAPAGVDRAELVSGADRVIGFSDQQQVDLLAWRPRRIGRVMDEAEKLPVECWSAGKGALLMEAVGEPPLLVLRGDAPTTGRCGGEAVVVMLGVALAERGMALLEQVEPRLIALGGDEAELDRAFPSLRERLEGTSLVALDRGLALEV